MTRESLIERNIRIWHRDWRWWDAEMMPEVAAIAGPSWRTDIDQKRALVPEFQDRILAHAHVAPAPYVPHAFACLNSWPDYLRPFDASRIVAPVGLYAGLDGFEWADAGDQRPYQHFTTLFADVEADADGYLLERKAYNRFAGRKLRDPATNALARIVHPAPAKLDGRPDESQKDAEALRLKDSGMTNVQIAERLGFEVQRNDYDAPSRSRGVEEALRRARRRLP